MTPSSRPSAEPRPHADQRRGQPGQDRHTFAATRGASDRILEGRRARRDRRNCRPAADLRVPRRRPWSSRARRHDGGREGPGRQGQRHHRPRRGPRSGTAPWVFRAASREKASWVTLPAAGTTGEVSVDGKRITAWITAQAKSADAAPPTTACAMSIRRQARARHHPGQGRPGRDNAAAVAKGPDRVAEQRRGRLGDVLRQGNSGDVDAKTIAAGAENLAYPAIPGEVDRRQPRTAR